MPVLSGPDATRAFREWERQRLPPAAPRLPVFCITANVLEEHRLECERAGMVRRPPRCSALSHLLTDASSFVFGSNRTVSSRSR
jgi:CheY-like chemotaxis protein